MSVYKNKLKAPYGSKLKALCKNKPKTPCSRNSQQGVALITALLISALVTVAAVAMASRQQLDIRRTGNMLEADQAYMYALAAEALATKVLRMDLQDTQIDTLDEIWNEKLPPTVIEGGMISGSIEDLQGRFNLNNLVNINPGNAGNNVSNNTTGNQDPVQVEILQRILNHLSRVKEDVQFPPFLVSRVSDWIDPDLNSSPDGAEDLTYLSAVAPELPYRAANRFMANPSELAAIAGLSLADVAALKPYIVTLPITATSATPVNVNTAGKEVLMGLHEDISLSIAENLIDHRSATPFETAAEFVTKLGTDQITLTPALVSVSSDYFLITSDAAIGRTTLRMYSLLERTANAVRVVSRSIGTNEFN